MGPLTPRNYTVNGCGIYSAAPGGETLNFQNGLGSASVSPTASETVASAAAKINAATASLGIYAVYNPTSSGLSFQSVKPFSASTDATTANHTFTATGVQVTTPGVIQNNAADAIGAINKAVKSLGLVQGRVGAGKARVTGRLRSGVSISHATANDLLRSRSTRNRRARLKTFLECRDGAADHHSQALGGLKRNQIAHPVSEHINNGTIFLGRVRVARQLHGSAPPAPFKVQVAKLLFDKP